MTWAPEDDLQQELARSLAIRVRPGLKSPEDPRECGRRVAQEILECYVRFRDRTEDTEQR